MDKIGTLKIAGGVETLGDSGLALNFLGLFQVSKWQTPPEQMAKKNDPWWICLLLFQKGGWTTTQILFGVLFNKPL